MLSALFPVNSEPRASPHLGCPERAHANKDHRFGSVSRHNGRRLPEKPTRRYKDPFPVSAALRLSRCDPPLREGERQKSLHLWLRWIPQYAAASPESASAFE